MNQSLSVISICFNNLQDLIATCASVDAQTVLPAEHLIIDGSTKDDIIKWLTEQPQPAYRKWIHEKDNGIADAFNKGISNAKNKITHLLNSGDTYASVYAIETALKRFNSDDSLQWVSGQYIQHRGGIDVTSGTPFNADLLWKGMRTVAHPTMFIKKEVYTRHGLYNTDYKIAMDYDMLVRIRNEKNSFIEQPLTYFAPGGASNVQFYRGLKEVKKSYRTHIGQSFQQTIWQLRQKALHIFMQTALGKKWFQWKNRKKTLSD